jgi:autotransporter-associated beta strand protein/T5SS/PEP-CTERM-associated repeat protein
MTRVVADQVSVTQPWYDQDKTHDPTTQPNGGTTWENKYFIDSNHNGVFDPGESTYLSYQANRIPATDNSCWMASACNMISHRNQRDCFDHYLSWAYYNGITGPFSTPWNDNTNRTFTFVNGGFANYCLQAEGYGWAVMAQNSSSFSWVDPENYIVACLKADNPVSIGVWQDNQTGGHALTVYAINTSQKTMTIADSDKTGNGYTTYSYAVSGNNLTLNYGAQHNLQYICSFDDVGWWTAGNGMWENTSNWAARHLPSYDQAIYLTQSNIGTVTVQSTSLNVGVNETGSISQSAGTVSAPNTSLQLGYYAGSEGIYTQSGGAVSLKYAYVGIYGTGDFIQTRGTSNIGGQLYLGYYAGSNGTYNLSGAGQMSAQNENVGYYGTGAFAQTAGVNSIAGSVVLGVNAGSRGTYDLSGGTLSVQSLSKGAGSSAFNFGGGTLQANAAFSTDLAISLTGVGGNGTIDTRSYAITMSGALSGIGGFNKLGSGTLTLAGNNTYTGSTNVLAGTLRLGAGSGLPVPGSLTISGGVLDSNGFGHGMDSGTATVAGAGSAWINLGSIYVGNYSSSRLSISSGGVVNSQDAYLGYNAGVIGAAGGSHQACVCRLPGFLLRGPQTICSSRSTGRRLAESAQVSVGYPESALLL